MAPRKGREQRPAPNVRWSEARGSYVLNVRDQRLGKGRASLQLATDDAERSRTRRQAFFTLLDSGRYGAIDALRSGKVQWSDVERAVRTGQYDELRRASARAETVAAASKAWLREVKRRGQRAGTLEKYTSLADDFGRYMGPATTLDEVTTERVRGWLSAPRERTGRPWSPNAQKLARATGKQLLSFAIQRAKEKAGRGEVPPITENPFDKVTPAKVEATRVEFLRPAEWLEVERVATDLPELAMVAVGALAGLRAGEARHLRLGLDVDMAASRLRIQPREGEYAWHPKTRNSIRDVPMGARLHAILERHVALGYAGDVYLLIRAKRDRPMAASTLRDLTEDAFTAAGIAYGQRKDALTYHSLRHTFASWLCQRDVQLLKIGQLLGDTVEIVATTYGHLLPSDLDRAVRLIDDTLEGA